MELVDGSCSNPPEVGLEFSESHFDWIQVGAIGRQEEEPGTAFSEDSLCLFAFVAREIVENDDVAGTERRRKLGFDIGLENVPVHRRVDDPWSGQSITTERCDEGLGFPVSERRHGFQALATPGSSAQPCHFGRRCRFINKDKTMGVLAHARLPMGAPYSTFIAEFSAFAL